jgi:hypothetical protein
LRTGKERKLHETKEIGRVNSSQGNGRDLSVCPSASPPEVLFQCSP